MCSAFYIGKQYKEIRRCIQVGNEIIITYAQIFQVQLSTFARFGFFIVKIWEAE